MGWGVWTCNSKSMRVYADQGHLQAQQQQSQQLQQQLQAALTREAAANKHIAELQKQVSMLVGCRVYGKTRTLLAQTCC